MYHALGRLCTKVVAAASGAERHTKSEAGANRGPLDLSHDPIRVVRFLFRVTSLFVPVAN